VAISFAGNISTDGLISKLHWAYPAPSIEEPSFTDKAARVLICPVCKQEIDSETGVQPVYFAQPEFLPRLSNAELPAALNRNPPFAIHVVRTGQGFRGIVHPSWFDVDKRPSSPTDFRWNALLTLWHGSSFPRLERHLCEFRNPIAKNTAPNQVAAGASSISR
jgi:hypothetical protein